MNIMLQLKNFNEKYDKLNIEVCWHYDEPDEDMLEAGEEFEDMTGVSFTYIPIPV
jgi:hypothetical protein